MNKDWPFNYPVDYKNSEAVCPLFTTMSSYELSKSFP